MTLYRGYRVESARLKGWDYASPGWYYVTICTRNHVCYFGGGAARSVVLSRMGQIAEAELQNLPAHYTDVHLDAYVVMPNHVHAIVVIDGEHAFSPGPYLRTNGVRPSLAEIVRSYKSGVARSCHHEGFQAFAWQTRYHDHILRSNASVDAVRDYIQQNPANWLEDEENPRRDAARRVSRGVRRPT